MGSWTCARTVVPAVRSVVPHGVELGEQLIGGGLEACAEEA